MRGGPAVIDYSTAPINSALVEARQLADMTVGKLAEAAGFSSSFITYYERIAAHPNLTMKTMYRYAKAEAHWRRMLLDRTSSAPSSP